MSLLMDVFYMTGFGIAQMYGPLSYLAVLWLPKFLLDFIIYPFLPALNIPSIPFVKFFEEEETDESEFLTPNE